MQILSWKEAVLGRQRGRWATVGLMFLLLNACAVSPQGKAKLNVPAPISDVYSNADLQLQLVTAAAVVASCVDEECTLNHAFEAQVQRLGAAIAAIAFEIYPDLDERVERFEFEVAEKKEPGMASNAAGNVVILRGVQQIGLNEQALAFAIAREMGHVIAGHHDDNVTARILISVAAGLIFPALPLFGNSAAIAQATSSTITTSALATTAASTATSYLGAKLFLSQQKPGQLGEADLIALELLEKMGWGRQDMIQAFADSAAFASDNVWSNEFQVSTAQIMALESAADAGEPLDPVEEVVFEGDLPEMEEVTEEIAETETAEPVRLASIEAAHTVVTEQEVQAADAENHALPAVWLDNTSPKTRSLKAKKTLGKRMQSKPKKHAVRSKKLAMTKVHKTKRK